MEVGVSAAAAVMSSMTLQHKFGSLALIYVVSLTANVVLCAWCLLVGYEVLLGRFGETAQAETESTILLILLLNAACGLALALLGLRLVHRWVSRPVAALRTATAEIARGNLDHRINVTSRDELGLLASEVNRMAVVVVSMQQQLIEQERRTIAGQTVRCVVHNIRSPLTGIRWLAEAITMRPGLHAETAKDQQHIVTLVDRVLTSLQQFRESLSRSSLNLESVDVADLISQVAEESRPMIERQQGKLQVDIRADAGRARIDRAHLAPALGALVARLATRMQAGQVVRIQAGDAPDIPASWQLILSHDSPLPVAKADHPTNAGALTETPQERAAHLDTVKRAIAVHGGRLAEEFDPGKEDCFVVTLPR